MCLQVVKYKAGGGGDGQECVLEVIAQGYQGVICRFFFFYFADNPCLKEFPVRFMKPFQFIVFPSKVSK